MPPKGVMERDGESFKEEKGSQRLTESKGGKPMFTKSHPLQSKSEIILRNLVVVAMVLFFCSIF